MPDPAEQLEDRIHRLKAGLVAITRGEGSDLSESEFREIRRLLLGSPKLREQVPAWLKTASTLVEVNSIIRTQADQRPGGKWMNRAAMIAEGLNPLLTELDHEREVFESSGDLGDRIGSGGFGEVYRWRHKALGMDFAVKVLKPSFPEDDSRYIDRFFREARILLRLYHPNIIRLYDVGMFGRRPYIRMELLEGSDLNEVLRANGSLGPTQAAALVLALADALSHAHDQSVIHRDIKPSNVFRTSDGRICLIDFGLGAFVEGDLVSRLTRTGERAVGGLYAAPELLAEPGRLDPRADIYSLGAVWFTAVTGRPPAGSALANQLNAISGLSPRYKAAIMRSLAPEASRYQTAHDMAKAVKAFVEVGGPV